VTLEQPRARDLYAVVGTAIRQAIARAHAAQCTRKELRALNAVVSLVASYSRLEDRIAVADVADVARLHIVDARAALRSLRDKGVIVYEGKRSGLSRIGLPPPTGPDIRGDSASLGGDDLRGDSASTREAIRGSERSGFASPTEKTSEKTSEKGEPRHDVGRLLDAFAGEASRRGAEIPARAIRPIAEQVATLLDAGEAPDRVAAGLTRMLDKRLLRAPLLAELVAEAALRPTRNGKPVLTAADFEDLDR
jgi:hypothetical protein